MKKCTQKQLRKSDRGKYANLLNTKTYMNMKPTSTKPTVTMTASQLHEAHEYKTECKHATQHYTVSGTG